MVPRPLEPEADHAAGGNRVYLFFWRFVEGKGRK